MKIDTVSLRIPSDEKCFQEFYQQLSHLIDALQLPEPEKFRLALCVSEAFTNAYLHGNKRDPSKMISLKIAPEADSVRIDVEDEGDGGIGLQDFEAASPSVGTEKTSGRGLGIMRRYADKIKVKRYKGGGLRVSIFWDLNRSHGK